ncbi:MAG: AzlC family ABC transporter permease [Neisseria sp.]|nr:AzlC family ABC transporter permease [Neisseria sp.]
MDTAVPTPSAWRKALTHSLPVAMGYYPAGIAFGVLMAAAGLPLWLCLAASLIVYSGAAQYAAIPLLASGAGVVTLTLNTFIINLRHVFYGIPLLNVVPEKRWQRLYAFFALTDESFSVMTTLPEQERKPLFVKIVFLNQCYWWTASLIGFLLGAGLNRLIPNLDFALACLFVILWYEQFRGKRVFWPSVAALLAFFFAKSVTTDYVLLLAVTVCALFIVAEARLPEQWRIHHARSAWALPTAVLALAVMVLLWTSTPAANMNTAEMLGTQQPPWQQIMAIVCMGAVTFLLRFAPNLIPKRYFDSPYLTALNFALPLSVMTILIAASVDVDGALAGSLHLLSAQIAALAAVWLVYRLWRNVLAGMVVGVAVINIMLSLLN